MPLDSVLQWKLQNRQQWFWGRVFPICSCLYQVPGSQACCGLRLLYGGVKAKLLFCAAGPLSQMTIGRKCTAAAPEGSLGTAKLMAREKEKGRGSKMGDPGSKCAGPNPHFLVSSTSSLLRHMPYESEETYKPPRGLCRDKWKYLCTSGSPFPSVAAAHSLSLHWHQWWGIGLGRYF